MPDNPHQSRRRKRALGSLKGQIWIAPDFDETPQEIIDAFEGDLPDQADPLDGRDSPVTR